MNIYVKTETYRLQKTEQSFFISLPLRVELGLGGELVAAELHSDFHAVCVQVIKIRHACRGEKMSSIRKITKN